MTHELCVMNPEELDPQQIFANLPPNRCGDSDRKYINEVLDAGFGNWARLINILF